MIENLLSVDYTAGELLRKYMKQIMLNKIERRIKDTTV